MKVHGHLWIFNKMVDGSTISSQRASEKLTELCEKIDPRLNLPPEECEKRFLNWQNQ